MKCRFIIEKVNGLLKKNKSLDNISNTQAGHIQIDYRIACAMLNFTHQPCSPDGKNSLKIAKRIRTRTQIKSNKMEFFLNKRLDTKLIKKINLSEINDFPRLTIKKIQENIVFVSFQLKLSKSYVNEMVNCGIAYTLTDDFFETNKSIKVVGNIKNCQSKVIAAEITSRHRRSEKKTTKLSSNERCSKQYRTTYRLFIEYKPYLNKSQAIKGKENILQNIFNTRISLIFVNIKATFAIACPDVKSQVVAFTLPALFII